MTARVLFASVVTALLSSVAVLVTGWIVLGAADSGGVVPAFTAAICVGSTVYAALFTSVSYAHLSRRSRGWRPACWSWWPGDWRRVEITARCVVS